MKRYKVLLKSSDFRKLFSNFSALFVIQIANYVLPILVLPLLVRQLGAENFGLVMFAQSMMVFFHVFVDFGFSLSGTREVSLNKDTPEELSNIFSAILFIKVILLILGAGVLAIVIFSFDRFKGEELVYLLSYGIVIGQGLFPIWYFQGVEKMKVITLLNVSAKVIFTLLVFVSIREESDYLLVPIFNSFGFIISGILGLVLAIKSLKIRKPKMSLTIRLLKESSLLFYSNVATSLYTASNVFILGYFSGNVMAGIFASMEKLILAVKNIYVPIYQAVFPWLSKKSPAEIRELIKKSYPFIGLIGVLMFITILFGAETILNLLYNDQRIGEYFYVLQLLGLIAIFSGLNMLFNTLYFPAIKAYSVRTKILIAGAVISVILSLIFVPLYNINATAIITVVTELLLLIFAVFYFIKENPFKNA
ncbi:flippase [Robertkochia sediminum]|uniref:flippase n=1 Tax=Robertkochia sediminum TaxID=2785326 RepID=UPI0019338DC7|nr:flippase [Robertkochia sediminum]MBL7471755.1 flippase [Robertkochia sediminum]